MSIRSKSQIEREDYNSIVLASSLIDTNAVAYELDRIAQVVQDDGFGDRRDIIRRGRDAIRQLERDLTAARSEVAALKAENERLSSDAKEKSSIHIATLHDQAKEKIYYARVNAQLQKDNERMTKELEVKRTEWCAAAHENARLKDKQARLAEAEGIVNRMVRHFNSCMILTGTDRIVEDAMVCVANNRAHTAQSAKAQEGKDKANG